jgi:hypothetical protein
METCLDIDDHLAMMLRLFLFLFSRVFFFIIGVALLLSVFDRAVAFFLARVRYPVYHLFLLPFFASELATVQG